MSTNPVTAGSHRCDARDFDGFATYAPHPGLLERQIGQVWVEGELSNLRRQASGHSYFTLKDEGSQLSCVLFKNAAHAAMPRLEDGLKVQALGDISVYEPRGQYQMIVRDLQASRQGILQMRFEALKRRLAAEGLFDAARKRRLPEFPLCIALVTSPGGACGARHAQHSRPPRAVGPHPHISRPRPRRGRAS